MYLIHSNIGHFVDLTTEIKGSQFPSLEITEEQYDNTIEALSQGLVVRVVDGEILYLVNEVKKRADIVEERNKLIDVAGRFIDRPTYTDDLGLTTDDLDNVAEYYKRLRDMPQHYDESTDKQNWSYTFVDVYTSGKNSNKYQLFKPSFVK